MANIIVKLKIDLNLVVFGFDSVSYRSHFVIYGNGYHSKIASRLSKMVKIGHLYPNWNFEFLQIFRCSFQLDQHSCVGINIHVRPFCT